MNHSGKNIFHYACINGNIPLVKFLVKELNKDEIDFNAKDDQGKGGIQLACKHGNFSVIELLSQELSQENINFFDIDTSAKNNHGQNILHFNIFLSKCQNMTILGHLDIND